MASCHTALDGPIFVVGPSRSGTELVRAVLNAHPDIFIAQETHYFDDLRLRLDGKGVRELAGDEERICQDYFLALSHRPYGQGGEASKARIDRQELATLSQMHGSSGDAYLEAYCKMTAAIDVARRCLSRWGEKTPRHVFRLSEILTRYGDAQAICMVRDPRAVVASYRDWHPHQHELQQGQLPNVKALEIEARRMAASYDPAVASLMWKAAVNGSMRARRAFGDGRVRLVRYEDLILRPQQTVTELAEWLGIGFTDSMLDISTVNSSYNSVEGAGGFSPAALERWREKLSASEIAVIDFWSGPAMAKFGYERAAPPLAGLAATKRAPKLLGSALRAAWANRGRMGKRPGRYIGRRVSLLLADRRGRRILRRHLGQHRRTILGPNNR